MMLKMQRHFEDGPQVKNMTLFYLTCLHDCLTSYRAERHDLLCMPGVMQVRVARLDVVSPTTIQGGAKLEGFQVPTLDAT